MSSEEEAISAVSRLKESGILARRWFYLSPQSLEKLSNRAEMPISEKLSKIMLCLLLYSDMKLLIMRKIIRI